MIYQTDGLLFLVDMRQLNTVRFLIQPHNVGFEMAGLAVNPQMRRMGRAFTVQPMALGTLRAGLGLMGRSCHIRVAVNAGRILMRGVFEGIRRYLQRYFCSPCLARTIRAGMALAITKCPGGQHPFIGVDVRLAVAIQAYPLPGGNKLSFTRHG